MPDDVPGGFSSDDPTLDDLLTRHAARTGVPRELLAALVTQESGGNPRAVNGETGAAGLGQLMPTTAASLGVSDRFNPDQSVGAAADYLAQGFARYPGDTDRALMYYYGGPNEAKWGPRTQAYPDQVKRRLPAESAGLVAEGAGKPAFSADDPVADAGGGKPAFSSDDPVADAAAKLPTPPTPKTERNVMGKIVDAAGPVAKDTWQLLKSGTVQAGQDLMGLTEHVVPGGAPMRALARAGEEKLFGTTVEKKLTEWQASVEEGMSPEQRQANAKKWWDSERSTFGPAWSDPRSYLSGVVTSLPETFVSMIPGGILARSAFVTRMETELARRVLPGMGADAAAAATAEARKLASEQAAQVAGLSGQITEGLLGGSQSERDVRDTVMKMSPEQLQQSEAYLALRRSGLSHAEARDQLARDLGTQAYWLGGLATGIFGGAGDRFFARALSHQVEGGLLKRMGKGAIAEGLLEEAPQNALQQFAQNLVMRQADPNQSLTEDVLNQTLGGAVAGGLMGAGFGVPGGRRGAEAASSPPGTAETAPIPAQDVLGATQPGAPAQPTPPAAPPPAGPPTAPPAPAPIDRTTQPAPSVLPPDQTVLPEASAPTQQLQPRDRSRPAAIAQMESIANAPDYDRLAMAPTPTDGAPMVASKGDKAIPGIQLGREGRVTFDDGTKVPVHYAVVEADQVVASHDITGKENPAYTGEQPDGTLVALNNGRTIGLTEAYKRGTAAEYKAQLVANAEQLGLDPKAIEAMSAPMLVRLYPDTFNARADLGQQSNAGGGMAMGAVETAKQDAANLTNFEGMVVTDNGDISLTQSGDFIRRFVANAGGNAANTLIGADGKPTAELLRRIRNAVFAKAYGGGPVLERVAESLDDNVKRLSAGMMQAAPVMASLREDMQAGKIDPALDIVPDFVAAVEEFSRLRMQQIDVGEWLRQGDIIGRPYSPATMHILANLAEFGRSAKALAEFLRNYAEQARQLGNVNQASMFGGPAVDKMGLLQHTRKISDEAIQQGLSDTAQRDSGAVEPGAQAGPDTAGPKSGDAGDQQDAAGPSAPEPPAPRPPSSRPGGEAAAAPAVEKQQAEADLKGGLEDLGKLLGKPGDLNARLQERELPEALLTELRDGTIKPEAMRASIDAVRDTAPDTSALRLLTSEVAKLQSKALESQLKTGVGTGRNAKLTPAEVAHNEGLRKQRAAIKAWEEATRKALKAREYQEVSAALAKKGLADKDQVRIEGRVRTRTESWGRGFGTLHDMGDHWEVGLTSHGGDIMFVNQGDLDAITKRDQTGALPPEVKVFASGMSRIPDFEAALASDNHVGVEIGELSDNAMNALALAFIKSRGHLFVDSGAFSLFRANQRARNPDQFTLEQFGEGGKALDFNDVLAKMEELQSRISDAETEEEMDGNLDRAYFVMPDVVGSQEDTLFVLEHHLEQIIEGFRLSNAIFPLQAGKLSLTEFYEALRAKMGDAYPDAAYEQFIVGIPANKMAAPPEQVEELLRKHGDQLIGVHFLGAGSREKLQPYIDAVQRSGFDGEVSGDSNALRAKLYGDTDRATALRKALEGEADPKLQDEIDARAEAEQEAEQERQRAERERRQQQYEQERDELAAQQQRDLEAGKPVKDYKVWVQWSDSKKPIERIQIPAEDWPHLRYWDDVHRNLADLKRAIEALKKPAEYSTKGATKKRQAEYAAERAAELKGYEAALAWAEAGGAKKYGIPQILIDEDRKAIAYIWEYEAGRAGMMRQYIIPTAKGAVQIDIDPADGDIYANGPSSPALGPDDGVTVTLHGASISDTGYWSLSGSHEIDSKAIRADPYGYAEKLIAKAQEERENERKPKPKKPKAAKPTKPKPTRDELKKLDRAAEKAKAQFIEESWKKEGAAAFAAGLPRELPKAVQLKDADVKKAWFAGWDEANVAAPVEQTTPGTRIKWATLGEWTEGLKQIKARQFNHRTGKSYTDIENHWEALVEHPNLIESATALAELAQLRSELKEVKWARGGKGVTGRDNRAELYDRIDRREKEIAKQDRGALTDEERRARFEAEKEKANAVQKSGTGTLLQREPGSPGGEGGERGRVEPGEQGQGVTAPSPAPTTGAGAATRPLTGSQKSLPIGASVWLTTHSQGTEQKRFLVDKPDGSGRTYEYRTVPTSSSSSTPGWTVVGYEGDKVRVTGNELVKGEHGGLVHAPVEKLVSPADLKIHTPLPATPREDTPKDLIPAHEALEAAGFRQTMSNDWGYTIAAKPGERHLFSIRAYGQPREFRLSQSVSFPGTGITGSPTSVVGVYPSPAEAIAAFNQVRARILGAPTTPLDTEIPTPKLADFNGDREAYLKARVLWQLEPAHYGGRRTAEALANNEGEPGRPGYLVPQWEVHRAIAELQREGKIALVNGAYELAKPAAPTTTTPPLELTAPTESKLQTDAERAAAAERERQQRENAPPPEDFLLSGSNRPADVGAAAGQQDIFGAPANKSVETPGEPPIISGKSPEQLRAEADLQGGLADLADLLGKGTRLNITPEQEQKLLPILTRLFDAAFRLGKIKFKEAARYVLDQIRTALGPVADQIGLDHLQGAYIAMAGRYRDQGADSIGAVAGVASLSELNDVTDQPTSEGVERPGSPGQPGVGVGAQAVPAGLGTAGGSGESGVQRPGSENQGPDGGVRGAGPEAAAAGAQGDSSPFAGPAATDRGPAGDLFGGGSVDAGIGGASPDGDAAETSTAGAVSPGELIAKREAQRLADQNAVIPGDRASIDATLPFLTPEQRGDVQFAEERFALPEGYGVLFTNQPGTGKTYTGLGIIKRLVRQGRDNILVTVPSDKVAADWMESAQNLGLNITKLADTKDAGRGVVITTYANFRANEGVIHRKWDAFVTDEAHHLMQQADGNETGALGALRALTFHPDGLYRRVTMKDPRLAEQLRLLNSKKSLSDAERAVRDRLQEKRNALQRQVEEEFARNQLAARPRVVMLSATPFAYETSVQLGEGYLFEYDRSVDSSAYNSGGPYERFMMTHFGYRMRYNKLTKPGPEVDSGLLQRMFNTYLKQQRVLSGRMLEVPHDYDRRFVLTESEYGRLIDDGLTYLWNNRKFAPIEDRVRKAFDSLHRRYTLEAIKAQEVIPLVKAQVEAGRRVVVFHDYKKNESRNPFDVRHLVDDKTTQVSVYDNGNWTMRKLADVAAEFIAARPDLVNMPLRSLPSPIEAFKAAFGERVLIFNGDINKTDRRRAVELFQTDGSPHDIILVQSDAGREGISLHDTTGVNQRVIYNLGLPTKPTAAIQQEGRIMRIGVQSNAMFRYLNTGTNWERWAFADTIAERASAAENLALGEQARALLDGFIEAFEESDAWPIGHEGEGTGGKARDAAANAALTEWDRAVTIYFAQQKKTSRTKAQEGKDYFATPEPLGLKMVEWADVRANDRLLEPSAGHGAIGRWFPELHPRTLVEPSPELSSRLKLVSDGRIVQGRFEDLDIGANKAEVIVMNPPFGVGGSDAIPHLAKAAKHLADGGRIVALIPEGPAADKKFEKWFYGEEQQLKPVGKIDDTTVYRGDTVIAGGQRYTLDRVGSDGTIYATDESGAQRRLWAGIEPTIEPTGPRTTMQTETADLFLAGEIKLPRVTFARAGTEVATRIVIIEKQADRELANKIHQARIDLSDAETIGNLFDRIRDLSLDGRVAPAAPEEQTDTATVSPTANPAAPLLSGRGGKLPENIATVPRLPSDTDATYTTRKGKVLTGIVRRGITHEQAKAIDQFTFKHDGGWFIRDKYLQKPLEAAPAGPPLFIDRNGQGVGDARAGGLDGHGNALNAMGVDNTPAEAVRLGLTYLDSSGDSWLAISGKPADFAATRAAVQTFANQVQRPIRLHFDARQLVIEPQGPLPSQPFMPAGASLHPVNPALLRRIEQVVGEVAAKVNVPIVIERGSPTALHENMSPIAPGAYYAGRVHIWPANIASVQDLYRVLAHEIVGHASMIDMMGLEKYGELVALIQKAKELGNKEVIRLAAAVGESHGALTPFDEASEIIARATEEGVDLNGDFKPGFGWLKEIYAKIAAWLRDIGIPVRFSVPELQGLLLQAQRYARQGYNGRYAAASPDTPYTTDLFGAPLPDAPRGPPSRAPERRTRNRNVQPAPAVQRPGAIYATEIRPVQQGLTRLGVERVRSALDAAHVFADLRRFPRELFAVLVLDKDQKPLAYMQLFAGAEAETSVYPGIVAKAVYATPGAASIWLAHNHPSGIASPSAADARLTQTINQNFGKDLGVQLAGHVVIAGTRATEMDGDGMTIGRDFAIPAAPRQFTVPITELMYQKQGSLLPNIVNSPRAAQDALPLLGGGQPGVILLDSQRYVKGWYPMTLDEMLTLRTGDRNTGFGALMQALARSGAKDVIVGIPDPGADQMHAQRAIANMVTAITSGGKSMTVLDGIIGNRSLAERGELHDSPGNVFKAMPRPSWYSPLRRAAASSMRMAGTGQEWIGELRNKPGLTPMEIEWSGLYDWLRLQEGKVTKAAILDYMDRNGIKIVDVTLSNRTDRAEKRGDLTQQLVNLGYDPLTAPDYSLVGARDRRTGATYALEAEDVGDYGLEQLLPEDHRARELLMELGAAMEDPEHDNRETAFDNWTLPGGDNYREILLTLPRWPNQEMQDRGLNLRKIAAEPFFQRLAEVTRRINEWHMQSEVERAAALGEGRTLEQLIGERSLLEMQMDQAANAAFAQLPNDRFRSGHFAQPNILAHLRIKDRRDQQGRKVLFVEEFQSDWAEQGREHGFKGGDGLTEEQALALRRAAYDALGANDNLGFDTRQEAMQSVIQARDWRDRWEVPSSAEADAIERYAEHIRATAGQGQRVARAPYVERTQAWVALLVKHAISIATAEGHDVIAWTTGDQQNNRYNLANQVDTIHWNGNRLWGSRHGNTVINEGGVTQEYLPNYIGAELAAKLADAPEHVVDRPDGSVVRWRQLSGLDLEVGGDAMRTFYDKMVPNIANDVLKKLGAGTRVTTIPVNTGRSINHAIGESGRHYWQLLGAQNQVLATYDSEAAAREGMTATAGQPGFEVTPALRASAAQGMPLAAAPAGRIVPHVKKTSITDAIQRKLGGELFRDWLSQPLWDRIESLGARIIPERVKVGIGGYNLPEPYLVARTDRRAAINAHLRRAKRTIDSIMHLDRVQSRVAYNWMTTNDATLEPLLLEQLPEDSRAVLQTMKAEIAQLGREAVELGLLSQDSHDRNELAYLHRSYRKYESTLTAAGRARRTRAVALHGENFRLRGLRDDAGMEQILQADQVRREELGQRADTALRGRKYERLERRQRPTGSGTLPGMFGENLGRLQQVVYIPAGTPIPPQFQGWRNDGIWEARFFDKAGKVGMWRDFTADEQQRMGVIDEVRFAFAKTMMNMVSDLETAKFLRYVATNYSKLSRGQVEDAGGTVIDQPVDAPVTVQTFKLNEWVQVPDVNLRGTGLKKYGALSGRFIPGSLWNDIRSQVNLWAQTELGEAWDQMMRVWKLSKTALSPAVHTNNVMSNFILADLADVRGRDIVRALRILYNSRKGAPEGERKTAAVELLRRYEDSGAELGSLVRADLQHEVLEPLLREMDRIEAAETASPSPVGLLRAVQIMGLVVRMHPIQAYQQAKMTAPGRLTTKALQAMIDVYQSEDMVFRLAAFTKAVEEGRTDRQAGDIARKAFLDYHIDAPWVQVARRTAIPFIAFSYRAIPIIINGFVKTPWKMLKYGLVGGGLNALAYAMMGLGGDDEDKERRLLPDELQGRTWGVFPRLIRMPWNNANDAPVFLDVRRWIPGGDLIDLQQAHGAIALPSWLSLGGPLSMVAEISTNHSIFTGEKLTNDSDTLTEKVMKDVDYLYKFWTPNLPIPNPLGYVGELVTPAAPAGFMQTHALTNVGRAVTGEVNAIGQEHSLASAGLSSVGVKVAGYPEDLMTLRARGKAQGELRTIGEDIAKINRARARGGLSDERADEKLDYQQEKRQKVIRGLADKVGGSGE